MKKKYRESKESWKSKICYGTYKKAVSLNSTETTVISQYPCTET